jgi:Glyoxalase-like domain
MIPKCMTRRELFAAVGVAGFTALMPGKGGAMEVRGNIKVLFIAGFGPIVSKVPESRKLYSGLLGIAFKEEGGEYLHTEALQGAKSFALWPLSQAAQSCFGKDSWPDGVPVPQAWLEFDVDNVESATAELEAQGHRILVRNKKEPWGQTVSRFLSPEGLLVGVTSTPWMREGK